MAAAARPSEAIAQVLSQPAIAAPFATLDLATPAMTPAAFGACLSAETKRMREVAEAANLKPQ